MQSVSGQGSCSVCSARMSTTPSPSYAQHGPTISNLRAGPLGAIERHDKDPRTRSKSRVASNDGASKETEKAPKFSSAHLAPAGACCDACRATRTELPLQRGAVQNPQGGEQQHGASPIRVGRLRASTLGCFGKVLLTTIRQKRPQSSTRPPAKTDRSLGSCCVGTRSGCPIACFPAPQHQTDNKL